MTRKSEVVLTAMLILVALVSISIAMAQSAGSAVDTADNALATRIAGEEATRSASDTTIINEMTGHGLAIDALKDADARIIADFKELERRVKALEDTGGTPPPGPGPAPTAPAVLASNFPTTTDGRPVSQLGLGVWRYWSYEEPFIDLTKGTPLAWQTNNWSHDWKKLWAEGVIDKATLYPKSIPAGAASIWGGIYRANASVIPTVYAGTYVLDWEGDADIRLTGVTCGTATAVNCQRVISSRRVEATFDAAIRDHSIWEILRIGPGGVRNIRLYRKENEAALNAGKILNPKFQAHTRRYKVLRFLDPQSAHHARPFRAGDFAKPGQATFAPEIWPSPADAPKQTPFDVLFRVANEADASAWVHVAGLPGAPKSFDAISGDPGGSYDAWKAACKANLAVILASGDWLAYFDNFAAGLASSVYPNARTVYVEFQNEIWNYGFPFGKQTSCMDGFAEAMGKPAFQNRYAYGYFAAKTMIEADKALRRAGRAQAWTVVLAGQMASEETTRLALEGFKAYFVERGMDPQPWLKHVGVSAAAYYDGSLDRNIGFIRAATDAEHVTKLKAAIAAGAASKARADWLISGSTTQPSTIPWIVAQRKKHQVLAEAAGAYYVGEYEGMSHEQMPAHLAADPAIVAWNDSFMMGAEHERVVRALNAALLAQNPKAGISNYQSIGARGPGAPWVEGQYGEVTGVTRALEQILRTP